jgi:hypothetical protein
MPTIPPDILDCTVYLYASAEAAAKGEGAGGSGFLVVVPFEGHPAGTLYAVTNSHVVGEGFTCVRLNTMDGGHDAVTLDDSAWVRHPDGDDVSVAEIGLASEFRYKLISTDSFVDGYDQSLFAVGQEVFMVGRFVNHEGKQRNRPTVRFGNIAQLPFERIRTTRGIEQEGFLVDMRSLAGYSGSPVFVYRARPELDKDPEKWIKSIEVRFLGIDFGHLPTLGAVLEDDRNTVVEPKLWAEQNSGMAAVIPAWRLKQVLFDDDQVVRQREEGERKWLEDHGDQSEDD